MTKTELATAVLKHLSVIGASESSDADDAALVTEVYDSVYPQLRKLGLAPFAATSIDAWAERPMVELIAAKVGPEFGHRDPMKNDFKYRTALKDLQRQMSGGARGIPTKMEPF